MGLNISIGQVITASAGFEHGDDCPSLAYSFFNGCIPGWISTHGSPDTYSNYGFGPAEGEKYAHMYVAEKPTCENYGGQDRGEGIAWNMSFNAGTTYHMTFAIRSLYGPTRLVQWVLTDGRPNQGSSTFCSPQELVPPLSGTDQVVWQSNFFSHEGDWQILTIDFTPVTNHSQLWFRASNHTASPVNDEISTFLFLDAISISYTPPPPTDCQANFEVLNCGENDCAYYLFNTSTPSSTPCPDEACNPIKTTKWSVRDLQDPYARIVTSTNYNFIFYPSCNGFFQVCLTIEDCNGCVSTMCQTIQVSCTMCYCVQGWDPCSGVTGDPDPNEDHLKSSGDAGEFSIYPNPASTEVEIETGYARTTQMPLEIALYDLHGKVVRTSTISAEESRKTLDINGLPAGVYMIRISEDGALLHTEKLLIGK